MSISPRLQHITAQASTPDQLLHYVAAVSPSRSSLVGDCVVHVVDQRAVLVAYPLHCPQSTDHLDQHVAQTLALPGITHISVLAPIKPPSAPPHAICTAPDHYWSLPLPAARPGQKLRNMLRRAAREASIDVHSGRSAWTGEHQEMMLSYIQRRPLEPGMRYIFQHLDTYLDASPDVLLFSARNADGLLLACAIGDFASLGTAFYMFAFRRPDAPPGVADGLLEAIVQEGAQRGHSHCNLGLGINKGIGFFKTKWAAIPFLPCIQCDWDVQSSQKSWLSRIFSS